MTHVYWKTFHDFMHREISDSLKQRDLTVEQAAEILEVEPRTLSYILSGKTMCSSSTLLMYVARLCPDFIAFAEKLENVISVSRDV